MLLLSLASAETLVSDQVAVGVASDGSLVDQEAWLGVLHDPDGPGGDPTGTDLLLPGRAFEAWGISHAGGATSNSVPDGSGIEVSWEPVQDSGAVQTLRGTAEVPGATLELELDLPAEEPVLYTRFVVTAIDDLDDVWLSRSVDADIDYLFDGDFGTANGAEPGVAWSASLVMDKALALAVLDGQGGICSWCTTPDGVLGGSTGEVEGDAVIGVAVSIGSLSAGQSAEVVFAYGFGAGVDEAVQIAEEAAAWQDRDGDGFSEQQGDCDDRDPWVGAHLDEVPDGLDNDCDEAIDEDTSVSDDDGDGLSEADGDCDDGDPEVTDCPEAERPEEGVIDEMITENEAVPGKGCAVPVGAGGAWLIGLVALRRRR